jgi:hypothetical protein
VKTAKAFPTILASGISILAGCGGGDALPSVFRDAPKISRPGYVRLEKLYDIDVTHINMFNKENAFERFIDFDDHDNMYIADSFQCKIFVYDNEGKFLRSFGRPGQGPEDFERINSILVDGDRLRVFVGWQEIKNVSLSGEYISKDSFYVENRLNVKIIGNGYYVLRAKLENNFTQMDLILSSMDKTFSSSRDLLVYRYPPGFRGPNYDFRWNDWLFIANNGEFYFPEDNLNKYSIVHYGKNGKPFEIVGRSYTIERYSGEAERRFNRMYKNEIEKGEMKFPDHPPVINLMFLDKRGNLWALIGETYEDNRNSEFNNTVDIFDSRGNWIYSMKTKSISKYCLYNNGKIYKASPVDEETTKQYLEVYEIIYSNQ